MLGGALWWCQGEWYKTHGMHGRLSLMIFVMLSGSLSCGSSVPGSTVSSIGFSPNPAVLSSGVCTSTAQIEEIAGQSLSIASANAVFTDSSGGRADFSFDAAELASVFGTLTIPAHGIATGSFRFDLASKGVKTPAEGTLVTIGVGLEGKITNFVGALRCEGSS
jgi:hypothetical protein